MTSVRTETAPVAVTKFAKSRHLALGYEAKSQLAAIGTHRKTVVKNVITAAMPLTINSPQIARRTGFFWPVRRSRKSRMEVLTRAKIGL